MDEEDQLPEENLPDPQEFREPLEEGAQANEQEMSESPGVDLPEPPPESVSEMQEMGSDADAEESLDQPPPEELPPEEPTPQPPDDGPEPPPLADLAEMGADTAKEAQVGVQAEAPSAVDEMESMGADAAVEQNVTGIPTQEQQVRGSQTLRAKDLFEFDAGTFEADQSGMDWTSAESSYREVNFQWQRIMTAMVIDHQHRLEQLLAMLERER